MLKLEYKDYQLDFKFDAATSRGKIKSHRIWVIKVFDDQEELCFGLGEAAPLAGLSPESFDEVGDRLAQLKKEITNYPIPASQESAFNMVNQLVNQEYPSLVFGLQMALLDLLKGGDRQLFDNDFFVGKRNLKINGLIWMGDTSFMKSQIDEKFDVGFKCIKMKVGALDFEEELSIIKYLRKKSDKLVIRLDANGGFANNEVLSKLSKLSDFNIHSIEQPIMPGQHEAMQLISSKSPVPIAFDEELVNIKGKSQKFELLKYTKPKYLVLKPTLLGGIQETLEWIELAHVLHIDWWITSALESNVGLNAVAQLTSQFDNPLHQGLGTGALYHNNFKSPLTIHGEYLTYDDRYIWDLPDFI